MVDLNDTLEELNTSITSITNKVNGQKAIVANYKQKLINKLGELFTQIQQLKENPALASIPQLKQQLQQIPELQEQLKNTNIELENTKAIVIDLQKQIEKFEADIADRDKQIKELTDLNNNKDKDLSDLNDQVTKLTEEKTAIQNQLTDKTAEMNDLVTRIGNINTYLLQQIGLIDTITAELGDLDSGNIGDQFKAISENIQIIVNMINNPLTGGTEAVAQPTGTGYDVDANFTKLMALYRLQDKREYLAYTRGLHGKIKYMIDQNIKGAEANNPKAIKEIKNILTQHTLNIPTSRTTGGKRKRRTMKKRHRRTRKHQKGGYVYSSSKQLDKVSSVISASSGSKSNSSKSSNSKSKRKDKTRRKSMK